MCVISLCTRGALDTLSRGRSTAALERHCTDRAPHSRYGASSPPTMGSGSRSALCSSRLLVRGSPVEPPVSADAPVARVADGAAALSPSIIMYAVLGTPSCLVAAASMCRAMTLFPSLPRACAVRVAVASAVSAASTLWALWRIIFRQRACRNGPAHRMLSCAVAGGLVDFRGADEVVPVRRLTSSCSGP